MKDFRNSSGNNGDMGSNPTTGTMKIGHCGSHLHKRFPNCPAGPEWKTRDVKAELDL